MAEWWKQLSDGISGFAEQLVQQANSAQQDIEREHQRLAAERSVESIKQVGKRFTFYCKQRKYCRNSIIF